VLLEVFVANSQGSELDHGDQCQRAVHSGKAPAHGVDQKVEPRGNDVEGRLALVKGPAKGFQSVGVGGFFRASFKHHHLAAFRTHPLGAGRIQGARTERGACQKWSYIQTRPYIHTLTYKQGPTYTLLHTNKVLHTHCDRRAEAGRSYIYKF
jgi:hypothetical protein